ncbi:MULTISPECIES: hypothetical protein [Caballeronia]|uniref:Uncharacterized protein n=1 Tax=Caballeronia jiangsuensis TaxID=1458357 RepID=A0ABW9CI98_9BURK|nr:hypothetical protein [Caballeronia sp. GaOx3]
MTYLTRPPQSAVWLRSRRGALDIANHALKDLAFEPLCSYVTASLSFTRMYILGQEQAPMDFNPIMACEKSETSRLLLSSRVQAMIHVELRSAKKQLPAGGWSLPCEFDKAIQV